VARFNVLSKTDRALAAYIISEGGGSEGDVFPMKRADDVPNPPYTVAASESCRSEHAPIYRVKSRIDVFTNCAPDVNENTETMKLDSDERVALTFDAFHLEADGGQGGHALAEAITTAGRNLGGDMADFTVQDVIVGDMEQGSAGKEGQWIDSLSLELVVCPHDVI
jgi:hypothetical protein